MAWVPRSERLSGESRGPYDGVPDHLAGPLMDWFVDTICMHSGHDALTRVLAMRLSIPVPAGAAPGEAIRYLQRAASKDEETFLDIVEGTLVLADRTGVDDRATRLRDVLSMCGSTLTVNKEGTALVEAVGQEAQETYDAATSVEDSATADLQEAWVNAYGRSPDPSDAWDHAIKAVEHVLLPILRPNDKKATLGAVIGDLSGGDRERWEMVLPGNDKSHDVAPLVSMLRLLWPNHDRHGGQPPRQPALHEAKAVVSLAAMIVQWDRQGWVLRRREAG